MLKKSTLYKSLNIEANEALPVFMLIAQSIFLGIFYGAFDIAAHTLFLKHFPENMIPKAYIVSGIVGIILTAIFSKVQSKLKFSSLARYSLLFISVSTLLMWLFFQITLSGWTVFLAFILLGPLNIIAILAFWGTVGRMFNLRQGKRLFGIIDTGQILGIIFSSFAIPLVLGMMRGTHNLFLICGISIVIAMLIEIIISNKYNLDGDRSKTESKSEPISEHEQVKLKTFVKNPYLRYMALFVAFSMFTAFFVQFSFLVVTNEKYPLEDDMAKYLGFFTGSMMIFTLLIKTFVYSKLLKTYGLQISLLLSSALIALFTAIAIIAGLVGGFTVDASGFLYFFLLISLSKLFNKTLKDALEGPSFKLLYQSLSKKIRFDVQAKVDGTVNEVSALLSGVFLSILGLLAFIKLIHYSVALFVILLGWIYITFKLYREYRNSLEQALSQDTLNKLESVSEPIESDETIKIKQLLSTRRYMPFDYIDSLKDFVNKNKPTILSKIDSQVLFFDIACMNYSGQLSKPWTKYFEDNYPIDQEQEYSTKDLSGLLLVNTQLEQLKAISHIVSGGPKHQLTILTSLLRSHYPDVQRSAIVISGWLGLKETISMLAEFIESENLYYDAIISLSLMSNNSTTQLIQLFYKSDITLNTQQTLLELLGNSKNETATRFFIDNLSYHKTEIVYQSVSLLRKSGFQANDNDRHRFYHPITLACHHLSWDIAALASINQSNEPSPLNNAIESEFRRHMDHLFNLLSITYKAQSVKHVKDYLDSGSSEGNSYALELFDLFISEEIKPIVIPIFEDLPIDEKVIILQNQFPIEIVPIKQLIINILNRDPNYISKHTKKIALNEYPKYFDTINEQLIAQIFSPVRDLQLLASKIGYQLDQSAFRKIIQRIEPKQRKTIEAYLNNPDDFNVFIHPDNQLVDVWKSKTNLPDENIIEFSDCLDYGIVKKVNTLEVNINPDKYFVLLTINNTASTDLETNTLGNFYIDNQSISKEINEEDGNIFIGIDKIHVNKLCVNNKALLNGLLKQLK